MNNCPHPGGICTIIATLLEIIYAPTGDKYQIRYSVRDDGPGLSLEEQRDVIIPLRSIPQSTISLLPFKKIVSAHGGLLDVKSAIGKGSTFSFTIDFEIPITETENVVGDTLNKPFTFTKADTKQVQVKETSRLSFPESKGPLGKSSPIVVCPQRVTESYGIAVVREERNLSLRLKSTCLVVDDVSSNRLMIGRVMNLMGFEVTYAEDGLEAVDMCIKHTYDLVRKVDVLN
jgi:hypothetical protein